MIMFGLFSISLVALASSTEITVNCQAPEGYSSGFRANVSGVLTLMENPHNPALFKVAKGSLTVEALKGSAGTQVLYNIFKFENGQYNTINGTESVTLGNHSPSHGHLMVYINLTKQDGSHVLYNGFTYIMNCVE